MKVFISWSGDRSRYIAETLRDWLQQVIQALEPWISVDIQKGKRWNTEIAKELEQSEVGIICLTEDNLDSPWIHFEAGAIAKKSNAYVCTFLYGITPTSVVPPLSDFQHTKYEKDDMLKLLFTINEIIKKVDGKALTETNLKAVFETFWPQLRQRLDRTPGLKTKIIQRPEREILEEILELIRRNSDEKPNIGERLRLNRKNPLLDRSENLDISNIIIRQEKTKKTFDKKEVEKIITQYGSKLLSTGVLVTNGDIELHVNRLNVEMISDLVKAGYVIDVPGLGEFSHTT